MPGRWWARATLEGDAGAVEGGGDEFGQGVHLALAVGAVVADRELGAVGVDAQAGAGPGGGGEGGLDDGGLGGAAGEPAAEGSVGQQAVVQVAPVVAAGGSRSRKCWMILSAARASSGWVWRRARPASRVSIGRSGGGVVVEAVADLGAERAVGADGDGDGVGADRALGQRLGDGGQVAGAGGQQGGCGDVAGGVDRIGVQTGRSETS